MNKRYLLVAFIIGTILLMTPGVAQALILAKRCSTVWFGNSARVRACVILEKSFWEAKRRTRLRVTHLEGHGQVTVEFRRVRLIRKGIVLKKNTTNKRETIGGTLKDSRSMGSGWWRGCQFGSANWWSDGRYRLRLVAPGWDWTPVRELTTPKVSSNC